MLKDRIKNLAFISVAFCFQNSVYTQDITSTNSTVEPKRIAALSPAIVKTLVDIGLEDKIACAAGPFDEIKLSSKVESLGLYHKPNLELIIKCKPDLIITTFAGTPPGVHKKLKSLGYNMMLEKPDTLMEIKAFVIKMSTMFKLKTPKIVKEFETICVAKKSKTALMVVGLNPMYVAGKKSFVSDAMSCAGYDNILDGGYKRVSIERVIKLNPDKLIVAMDKPEGMREFKMLKEIFKERIIITNPTYILEPSTRILKGIRSLKEEH